MTRTLDTDHVRERIAEERLRLRTVLEETQSLSEEGAEELSSLDQHPAEIGTETFDRERALSLQEQALAELEELGAAERRLDEGSYGNCEACGKPIGAERLDALPAARFCIEDQASAEEEAAAGA